MSAITSFAFATSAAIGVVMSIPAIADDAIPGRIIVARAVGSAIVLYDASAEVTEIVKDKVADASANDRLEREALRVLAKEEPVLSGASGITVRVTYTRTGDVSPVYGGATFAGIERYANVTMSSSDAKSDKDHWRESAAGVGPIPAFVQFAIVGKLPPRS